MLAHDVAAARSALQDAAAPVLLADGIDAHQVVANNLAWGVAHAEAAAATIEWAGGAADNQLAIDVAAAAAREALAEIGGSGLAGTGHAELLESIAERQRPLADLVATEEQRLLRATFREFARAEIAPIAADVHRKDLDVPEPLIAHLAELGVFGQSIPEEYGGSQTDGEDFEAMLIATEELSSASLAVGGSLTTRPEILIRALRRGATEEQKRRWLPEIARGKKLVSVATTEPDFGSDLAQIACRADRVEGGWRVTGTKLWCTFAGRAELLMLLLRTGDDGHRGLSVFVAEKPSFHGHKFRYEPPGGGTLEGRAIPTIGYRGMHTFELSFNGYFLPEEALLGGEEWLNRGFYLQVESFAMGRLQTAGRAVGVMEAALQDTLRYAGDRQVFGKPIIEFGLPKATLGRMIVRVVAARQLSYRAARFLNAGGGEMEASLAKLYACRMAEHVTRDAMQLHGAMGYAEETNVSRYFVDARVLSIFEGAEDVLALRVIAPRLLETG